MHRSSTERHDGTCQGRSVQGKVTQGTRVALSSEPEHLLVLRFLSNGEFTEEFNGPGALAWALVQHKPRPKNGQYQLSLASLRRLMDSVPVSERLRRTVA